jgi:hypothetical protein
MESRWQINVQVHISFGPWINWGMSVRKATSYGMAYQGSLARPDRLWRSQLLSTWELFPVGKMTGGWSFCWGLEYMEHYLHNPYRFSRCSVYLYLVSYKYYHHHHKKFCSWLDPVYEDWNRRLDPFVEGPWYHLSSDSAATLYNTTTTNTKPLNSTQM